MWAAIWLFQATRDFKYMREAMQGYKKLDDQENEFYWDNKMRGITVSPADDGDRVVSRKKVDGDLCANMLFCACCWQSAV